jgi:hypothetical protein
MYLLIRYGVHPGIGAIILLTGGHGPHFSGMNTMVTIITGIITTVRITVIHRFTAFPPGGIAITAADSDQGLSLLKQGHGKAVTGKPIQDPILPTGVPIYSGEIIQKRPL